MIEGTSLSLWSGRMTIVYLLAFLETENDQFKVHREIDNANTPVFGVFLCLISVVYKAFGRAAV